MTLRKLKNGHTEVRNHPMFPNGTTVEWEWLFKDGAIHRGTVVGPGKAESTSILSVRKVGGTLVAVHESRLRRVTELR